MSDPQQKEDAKDTKQVPPGTQPLEKMAEDQEQKKPLGLPVPSDVEMIEGMPPEVKRTVSMSLMGFSRGPVPHPLFEKFNEEHIHKFLDNVQKDDDNDYQLRSSGRWFTLLYAALILGVFIFLVVYLLPTNKDLLVDLFKLLVGFAGGFGSGYGLKTYLDRKR